MKHLVDLGWEGVAIDNNGTKDTDYKMMAMALNKTQDKDDGTEDNSKKDDGDREDGTEDNGTEDYSTKSLATKTKIKTTVEAKTQQYQLLSLQILGRHYKQKWFPLQMLHHLRSLLSLFSKRWWNADALMLSSWPWNCVWCCPCSIRMVYLFSRCRQKLMQEQWSTSSDDFQPIFLLHCSHSSWRWNCTWCCTCFARMVYL